jgi:hypothetical protein
MWQPLRVTCARVGCPGQLTQGAEHLHGTQSFPHCVLVRNAFDRSGNIVTSARSTARTGTMRRRTQCTAPGSSMSGRSASSAAFGAPRGLHRQHHALSLVQKARQAAGQELRKQAERRRACLRTPIPRDLHPRRLHTRVRPVPDSPYQPRWNGNAESVALSHAFSARSASLVGPPPPPHHVEQLQSAPQVGHAAVALPAELRQVLPAARRVGKQRPGVPVCDSGLCRATRHPP